MIAMFAQFMKSTGTRKARPRGSNYLQLRKHLAPDGLYYTIKRLLDETAEAEVYSQSRIPEWVVIESI